MWMPPLALLGLGPQGWLGQFVTAAVTTMEVAVGAYAFGTVAAFLLAWARLAGPRPLRAAAWLYAVLVRAIPMLLLIILLYFAGSAAIDAFIGWLLGRPFETSGYVASVLALGLVQAAYMSEVLRGAIVAVPRGMIEAAQSLALPRHIVFFKIVLPNMARIALPGMSNQWQGVLKDTALVSVVGFTELVTVGKNAAAATQYYIFFLTMTGLAYYILALGSGVVFTALQHRVERGHRPARMARPLRRRGMRAA